jgi:hypothetical protein
MVIGELQKGFAQRPHGTNGKGGFARRTEELDGKGPKGAEKSAEFWGDLHD